MPLDCLFNSPKTNWTYQTTSKQARRVKNLLDDSYSYLAGNAFGRDKKGRVRKDDPELQHLGGAGENAAEYTAYVYYEFQFEFE